MLTLHIATAILQMMSMGTFYSESLQLPSRFTLGPSLYYQYHKETILRKPRPTFRFPMPMVGGRRYLLLHREWRRESRDQITTCLLIPKTGLEIDYLAAVVGANLQRLFDPAVDLLWRKPVDRPTSVDEVRAQLAAGGLAALFLRAGVPDAVSYDQDDDATLNVFYWDREGAKVTVTYDKDEFWAIPAVKIVLRDREHPIAYSYEYRVLIVGGAAQGRDNR